MIRSTPRLLTTRISKLLIDNLETLCLITGTNKRYRIYTTTDESLIEGHWDLDPIEFDTVDDERVKTYLIEFFWLLQIRMISSAGYLCFPIAQAPPVTVTNIELGPRIIVRGRQFLSSFFKLF